MIQLCYLLESCWEFLDLYSSSLAPNGRIWERRERMDARSTLYLDTGRALPFPGGILRHKEGWFAFPACLALSPTKCSFFKTLNDYRLPIIRGKIQCYENMFFFFICGGFFSMSTFVKNQRVIITVINQCCALPIPYWVKVLEFLLLFLCYWMIKTIEAIVLEGGVLPVGESERGWAHTVWLRTVWKLGWDNVEHSLNSLCSTEASVVLVKCHTLCLMHSTDCGGHRGTLWKKSLGLWLVLRPLKLFSAVLHSLVFVVKARGTHRIVIF